MRRIVTRGRLAVGALLFAAACQFDSTSAPVGRDRPVVHAVLNPGSSEIVVLVERSLTGQQTVDDDALFDPRDPIVTGNGIPVTGALVEITGQGRTAHGIEDVVIYGDGRGRGVYRLRNSRNPGSQNVELVPGSRYTLRIRTSEGQVVTGSTVIPLTTLSSPTPVPLPFQRDRDTLRLRWPAAPGAKRYALRVDSPFGPFYLFTDAQGYDLEGGLRNFFAEELPHVFIPGFEQNVQVAAVDTNFVDYYRTSNDPFTGTGLVNHLEGGIGVFGSYVPLITRVLDVTGDTGEPPAGTYGGLEQNPADLLDLYVEARGSGSDLQLSGRLRIAPGDRFGVIGRLQGQELTLAAFAGQTISDTQFVFRGQLAGDSIRGEWAMRGDRRALSNRYRRR